MEIIYEFVQKIDASEVANVFKKSGIIRPVDDLDRIQRMVDNADIIVTARNNGELVGIARVITDYLYCCYLSDPSVDAKYQRIGFEKSDKAFLIRRKH